MADSRKSFLDKLLKISSAGLESIPPEEMKELGQIIGSRLLGMPGPRTLNRRTSPKELWFHRRLFEPATAIFQSKEALLDIQVYVRSFPYRDTRVSRTTHLRHSLEHFFQEAYILRQRMIDLLNSLQKDYTGSPQENELLRANQSLCKLLKDSLRSLMDARKEHVHGSGFYDDDLERIAMLEILHQRGWANTEAEKTLKTKITLLYRQESRKERRRWSDFVANWNKTIERLIDGYFEIIFSILFRDNGELHYPPTAQNYSD